VLLGDVFAVELLVELAPGHGLATHAPGDRIGEAALEEDQAQAIAAHLGRGVAVEEIAQLQALADPRFDLSVAAVLREFRDGSGFGGAGCDSCDHDRARLHLAERIRRQGAE
jgi:hypothetical protein